MILSRPKSTFKGGDLSLCRNHVSRHQVFAVMQLAYCDETELLAANQWMTGVLTWAESREQICSLLDIWADKTCHTKFCSSVEISC